MARSFTTLRCVRDDGAVRQFQGRPCGAGTGPRGALAVPSLAFSLSVHPFHSLEIRRSFAFRYLGFQAEPSQ